MFKAVLATISKCCVDLLIIIVAILLTTIQHLSADYAWNMIILYLYLPTSL